MPNKREAPIPVVSKRDVVMTTGSNGYRRVLKSKTWVMVVGRCPVDLLTAGWRGQGDRRAFPTGTYAKLDSSARLTEVSSRCQSRTGERLSQRGEQSRDRA